MKIYFITYGTKTPYDFTFALERIKKEAIKSGFFNYVKVYNPEDLDKDFKIDYQDILKLRRGGGYWIWKPQIIKQMLNEIDENDIIVYLDAGSTVNKDGKVRFDEYIKLLNESEYGFMAFESGSGRNYMIQELIDYFHTHICQKDLELTDKNYIATHLVIQKNNHSKLIIDEFFKIMEADPNLITDKYNNSNSNKKYPDFKDSRHDQSIFSLLFKVYGCVKVKDPHYFGNRDDALKNKDSKYYPFIATRQRTISSKQKNIYNQRLLLLSKKSR